MAKSGITGAVGMAIESKFCSVPVTAGSPAAVGIPGSNPLRYSIVETGAGIIGSPVVERGKEVDGAVEPRRLTLIGRKYQGSLSCKADPENLHYPLLGLFGRDVQSLLSSSPSIYQHIFLPGLYAPSFVIEEDIADGQWGRLSSGALVNRLDIEFTSSITARAQLLAHRQIPNSYGVGPSDVLFGSTAALLPLEMGGDGLTPVARTSSPSFVDLSASGAGGPLVFAGMGFGSQPGFAAVFMEIAGAPFAVELLPGSKITLEREITSMQVGGSGYDPGAAAGGRFLVSGSLSCLYEGMDLPLAALGGKQAGLNLKVTGALVSGSSLHYSMEIHLPQIRLASAPLKATDGALIIASSFVGGRDPVLGYSAKVTLVNTFNTSLLGGSWLAVNGPGGLGGWQNS